MAKKYFVNQLQKDDRIEDVFFVASKTDGTTYKGSTYLRMKLADKTGEIEAVRWDASPIEVSKAVEGEYLLVKGTINLYKESLQVVVDSLQKWGESVDPADFIPCSPFEMETMQNELLAILDTVKSPMLKKLSDSFFKDKEFFQKFSKAPAASRMHHAYISGLLEHTLSVTKNSVALSDLYNQIDRDLLITGAALHDIGKVEEFEWLSSIKYSDSGNLVGHLVGGAMMSKEAADKIEGFDPMLNLAVQHMILAHHGKLEYGSPKTPKSLEAQMLNFADDMDAKVFMYDQAIKGSLEKGESGSFTKKHYGLDMSVFKGVPRYEESSFDDTDATEASNGLLFPADDYNPYEDD